MQCKICNSRVTKIFNALVLRKHNVSYYQCIKCKFIQTEEPIWLNEAYTTAITDLDIGLVSRNVSLVNPVKNIITYCFNPNEKYLDYGGGYGIFVRLMRDNGFDFYRYDKYCDNIFAQNFDHNNEVFYRYNLLTTFEVFEHLVNPMEEISKMFELSPNILFTTEIAPNINYNNHKQWSYFLPEIGQHIAFYSEYTLNYIANYFNVNFYSNNGIHLFSPKKINKFKYLLLTRRRPSKLIS